MVKLSKCKASNFKEFSCLWRHCRSSKVTKIFCLACTEFYADNKYERQKLKINLI